MRDFGTLVEESFQDFAGGGQDPPEKEHGLTLQKVVRTLQGWLKAGKEILFRAL